MLLHSSAMQRSWRGRWMRVRWNGGWNGVSSRAAKNKLIDNQNLYYFKVLFPPSTHIHSDTTLDARLLLLMLLLLLCRVPSFYVGDCTFCVSQRILFWIEISSANIFGVKVTSVDVNCSRSSRRSSFKSPFNERKFTFFQWLLWDGHKCVLLLFFSLRWRKLHITTTTRQTFTREGKKSIKRETFTFWWLEWVCVL